MKKFLGFLVGLFFCSSVLASPVSITAVDATYDDTTTGTTSNGFNVHDLDHLTFIVEYDETEVGGGVTAGVTIQVSQDGTNWTRGWFFDYVGTTTLQQSETFSMDTNYIFWLDRNYRPPYVRFIITTGGTDADDTADLEVTINGVK